MIRRSRPLQGRSRPLQGRSGHVIELKLTITTAIIQTLNMLIVVVIVVTCSKESTPYFNL